MTIRVTVYLLYSYQVQRLSALGGSNVEGHTRRCLSFVLANELAVLFNWKGRDKLAFEKSHTMSIIFGMKQFHFFCFFNTQYSVIVILDAVRKHYPAEEGTDLKVANRTKDWLKYAKARCRGSNRS